MTTSMMHRPFVRSMAEWCAVEGAESLSIDAAANALLDVPVDEADEQEEAAEAPEIEETDVDELEVEEIDAEADVDETESTESDPGEEDSEDDPDEEDDDADDEAETEPELVIETPQFWDQNGKDTFAKLENTLKELPKELRPIGEQLAAHINANEKQRNAALSRKLNETATERKRYESALGQLDGFVSEVDQRLAIYEQTDWAQAAQQLDPKEYQAHRATFEQLKEQKAKAEKARSDREQQEFVQFVQERHQKLSEIAPEFLDPQTGAELDRQVTQFLRDTGYTDDLLKLASAEDLVIARKAMLYDQMQAKQAKTQKPKPVAGKTRRSGIKPNAPVKPVSRQQAQRQKLLNKGQLSLDEATKLLM